MQKNIDTQDRVIRFVIGICLLAYAWGAWSWLALLGALFCFYEAMASWCLIYQLLGKNSCPINKK